MKIQEEFQLILKELNETLKPYGFRKRGRVLYKDVNDVCLYLQLQKSDKTVANRLVVTVNVAIYSYYLSAKLGKDNLDRKPEAQNPHWRKRIGEFTPQKYDTWWDIHNSEDNARAINDIRSILLEYVLPSVEEISSTEGLIGLWRESQSPGLTQGQREKYLNLLLDA